MIAKGRSRSVKSFVVNFVLTFIVILSVIPASAAGNWGSLTAYAGPDQLNAPVGKQVELKSMGSDPSSDKISCQWTFTSRAPGSQGFIFSDNTAQAYFIPDVPGRYTIKLTVFDPVDGRTATDHLVVNAGTATATNASRTGKSGS
jgi:hypothetical protein